MRIQDRYAAVLEWFAANAAPAQSELVFADPYQLIVAVMLSAQCTDRRVNLTTPALFTKYPTVQHLAAADRDELFELVRSISYPSSKTDHLIGMARKVVSDFEGAVPSDIDSLMTLPGVGRKTANVVASITAGAPVIAVDTHVFRGARRLGLSRGRTPEAVERDLERHIAADLRPKAHHWLLLHGRYVCTARNPECRGCGLVQYCAKIL